MRQTRKALCIAALAVMGAITTGCSGQLEEVPGQDGHEITLTTSVTLGGNSESKALAADGVKSFAVGDQIAVIFKNTSGEAVKAVSSELVAGDIHDGGKTAVSGADTSTSVPGGRRTLRTRTMRRNRP